MTKTEDPLQPGAGYPPVPPPPHRFFHSSSALPVAAEEESEAPSRYQSSYGSRLDPLLAGKTAGTVLVEQPVLEPQPWALDFWGWLKDNTVGVARIDLRRPTPPRPDQYDGNILVVRRQQNRPRYGRVGGGFTQTPAPVPQQQFYRDGYPTGYVNPAVVEAEKSRLGQAMLGGGARVKITRSLVLARDEEGGKPLLDLGVGFSINMDNQRLEPVLRLKIKNWVSIKAAPVPVIRVGRSIPLFNTGMGIKALYEVPLTDVQRFWQPPARLMVRLESGPGSGIHLTPTGIEFDEKLLRFGKNLSMRASAGLTFPRSLPIDPENDDFGIKVHRLSLRSLW